MEGMTPGAGAGYQLWPIQKDKSIAETSQTLAGEEARIGFLKSLEKVGESLIDPAPRLRHNLAMNNEYQQYLKASQIQSLRNRQNEMDFLRAYQARMEAETKDSEASEFHEHHASELSEAHSYLDHLIHTLEHAVPSS